ncbi:flavodoxin reductase family protein [Candidatus Nitrososphaera evergladensis SR1]|uniref:ferredoxin--NADP(+) reductase n=1 Tax=Candidatus Nitrososphaera evergladensis SR1 TaxID=1459636 RepID=A0A075MNI2_9ARCH|nr:ferredoxin--NADP reductase [Candidatus Nitrososphaera evergladensis]AIF82710.1 flavodoxin reductase family protein [Candidatus Nitrososphaera evergladensis SR1]
MSVQPSLGKLVYRHDLTPDLAIIRIQPSDGSPVPDFRPGQFVTLGLKLDGEDKITNRAYSLSSPPEEKRYFELYIKWAQEPVPGKFTTALFDMKEGDELYWRKPAGAFTMEDKKADGTSDERTLVLVASGTGLAPFVAYVLHLRAIGSKRRIALLHGARNAKELGYRDLFERLAKENSDFIYLPTISRPHEPGSEGWTGHTGRVESLLVPKSDGVSELERALGNRVAPENSFFHICGYSGTIDNVISILQPLGFVSNRNKRKDGSFDIKVETYG